MSTEFNEDQKAVLDMVGNIMSSNAKFNADLTNSLMEGYERSGVRAEIELKLVRAKIYGLFADGYQPSESRIIASMYPDSESIDELTEIEMGKRNNQRGW